jgi:hypothetical protein
MSLQTNPFLRGYSGLAFQRLVEISHCQGNRRFWRPLHPSQAHLSDDEVLSRYCAFGNDFAVLTVGREVDQEVLDCCQKDGIISAVRYAIHAEEDGESLHLADAPSLARASEIVRRLTFWTGFYSRCWEISSWHLDRAALDYLARVADAALPIAPFIHAFRLLDGIAGLKLIGTPWNDAHLREIDGTTVYELRQAHRKHGMPRALVDVLHLAGEADVRILIFDGGAPRLDGLPTYDHD